ncbi:hypothetical protein [Sneathiella sp.]|uniref:hypothetical protein n=1 Tax=Sneathiella sp. TaxID=1964365 RepID=UPI00260419A6|nr:hypothetical protein [Sneathiella sp.]MDF2366308.1 hypothetical protein [Sneathiella sp.]
MAISNEGKACDAVVRFLEKETGENRANLKRPEKTNEDPPVELRLDLGPKNYAFEHTRIEAFSGQIQGEKEFGQFILPIRDELSGNLPGSAVYYLNFPTNARPNIKARHLEGMKRDFTEWVLDAARRLNERYPEGPSREKSPFGVTDTLRERPRGFNYEVVMTRREHWRIADRQRGKLLVSRYAPEDVEIHRAKRLGIALDNKCPKLHLCAAEGARTVLILEDNDVALSNHILIWEALSEVMAGREDLPDEIYLVDTSTSIWALWRLKYDEDIFLEDGWEYLEPNELADITNGTNS